MPNSLENPKNRSRHNNIISVLSDVPTVRTPRKILLEDNILRRKYIQEAMSCQEIADQIGNVCRQAVWKALKTIGVKMRSKKDAIIWVGGQRCKISQGYFWIWNPDHNRSNGGYVKRSVLVLEEKLGRPLQPGELPHHIDGNKLNDDPKNLREFFNGDHVRLHHSKK